MKKLLFGLMAAVMLISTGCSKDDILGTSGGEAKVTIEGKSYTFGKLCWVDATFNSTTTYTISNYDSQADEIYITLSTKKVGAITMDSANDIEITIGNDIYTSQSGTITTTAFDKSINGSFKGVFKKAGDTAKTYNVEGTFTSSVVSLGSF